MSVFTTAIHRYVDRGHVLQFRAFADEAARLAETYVEASVGRVYRQEDDGSFWLLLAHDPQSWARVDIGPEVTAARGDVATLGARLDALDRANGGFFPSSVVGDYFDQAIDGTGASSRAGAASRLELGPLMLPVRTRIDQIGVYVVTGVTASTVKLLIYGPDAAGWPGPLVYESAEVATETSSVYAFAACDIVLDRSTVYWAGCRYSDIQAVSTLAVASCRPLGKTSATATTQFTMLRRSETYANPAPDPFVFVSGNRFANAGPPSIRMRVAAL